MEIIFPLDKYGYGIVHWSCCGLLLHLDCCTWIHLTNGFQYVFTCQLCIHSNEYRHLVQVINHRWHFLKIFKYFSFERLSKSLREQKGSFKRYLWFQAFFVYQLVSIWTYALLGSAFTIIPTDYQWILALLSPIPREISTRMYKFISFKMGMNYK